MSEETTPVVGMPEADGDPESTIQDPTIIAKLRDEIRQLKSERTDLRTKWKQAEPVLAQFQEQQESQKTEAQKVAEQLAALQKQLADQAAATQRAQREAALTRLAVKANVDPEILPYLGVSKIDVDDEEAALGVLGKLASVRKAATAASDPGRGGAAKPSDEELRAYYLGGQRSRSTIFGG